MPDFLLLSFEEEKAKREKLEPIRQDKNPAAYSCECGCQTFYIAAGLMAVCQQCGEWYEIKGS